MYTPDFETLYSEYFLPSLKDDFEIELKVFPQDCPTGTFRSEGWDRTMLNKLEVLQKAILENWNDRIFFYSDIDIIFLKPILDISLAHLGDNDFVVQQGWPRNRMCAGFFVMRGNEKTLQLVTTAYILLQNNVYPDDQEALQAILNSGKISNIKWGLLPSEQYPNGRRVLKQSTGHYVKNSEIELPNEMILFHANCCIGLENKYLFLKHVQKAFFKNHFSQN
jgi:hypothetical protein